MPAHNLKRLPFDYYGRYRLAAEVVHATTPPGARVLDVGGGPGVLSAFVDDREVVACDVAVETDPRVAAATLVLADGTRLPFADGSFDAVVSLDTLEHVPPAGRPALLREASRVADGWLLIVCPCATDGVADADSAVLAYLRQRFGEQFASVEVLTDHLSYGHPDPDDVAGHLARTGADVVRFPSGRLDRWLPMMLLFYDLMALGRDDPVERVQAWYNDRHWRDDLRAPAYRQAFLARLPAAAGPAPADVVAGLLPHDEPEGDALGFQVLGDVLRESLVADVQALNERVRLLEAEVADARAHAAEMTRRAEDAEEHARLLRAFRDRVLAHPAVRARNALRRRG